MEPNDASAPILFWVLWLAVLVVFGYPFFRIVSRTGHSGWWVLLMLLPILNLIMPWVLAFKRWPALEPAPAEDSRP